MAYQAISALCQRTTEITSQFNVDPTILCFQGIDDILVEALFPTLTKGMMIPLFHLGLLGAILLYSPEYLIGSHKLIEGIVVWIRRSIQSLSVYLLNFKRMSLAVLVMVSMMVLYQCTPDNNLRPITSEQYIIQFDAFIRKVEQDKGLYDSSDWDVADDTYRAYTRTYFTQFSDDLTESELQLISRYKLKYHACKGLNTIDKTLESLEDQFLNLQNSINDRINN